MIKNDHLTLHLCFRAWIVSSGIKIMSVNHVFQTLLLLVICLKLHAQVKPSKPILDTAAVNHWTAAKKPAINDNGTYVGYMETEGYSRTGTLHLKSLAGKWEKEFEGVKSYAFSDDNSSVVILDTHNTLKILILGSDHVKSIPDVEVFKLFTDLQKEWLLYTNSSQDLNIISLKSAKVYTCHNVVSWYQSKDSNMLFLIKKLHEGYLLVHVRNNKEIPLGEFKQIENLVIDENGKQIAFIVKSDSINGQHKVIYYCKMDKSKPEPLKIVSTADHRLVLDYLQGFSSSGKYLLVKQKHTTKVAEPKKGVQIWSYSDPCLKSQQLKQAVSKSYLATINLETGTITQIEDKDASVNVFVQPNENFIVNSLTGDLSESHWNPNAISKNYIFNSTENSKKEVSIDAISKSPDQRYLIGRDSLKQELVAYEFASGKITVLTADVRALNLGSSKSESEELFLFAGWTGESKILFYDQYDIWQVDLANLYKKINLTKGYGRQHKLTFRFAFRTEGSVYAEKEMEILNAFDNNSKQNGYYKLGLGKPVNPAKLSMSDELYNAPGNLLLPDFYPIKATNADVWIVSSQKANRSPNYFVTNNFRKFRQVSEVYPEKKYNWLSSELINFRMADGKMNQAVLYKPENFDSTKKYPVIITYYEKLTDKVNTYLLPQLSEDHINVPWFVSREYIVCTPDILYKIGEPGESALNAAEGVLNSLSRLSFIDSNRVAVHGHSYGGYETNYIITHSNRFRAAMSASALCDLISSYGDVWGSGASRQHAFEDGQYHIGNTLWYKPELYIKNSPIFGADKVSTPLLMMNNRLDGAVNFSQGVEFFTGLRRLGKKVWMLEYDGEAHSLSETVNILDYTNKLEQFFGHYLKGEPMPDWMKPSNDN